MVFYHPQLFDLMGQTLPIGPTHDQFLESKETLEIFFPSKIDKPLDPTMKEQWEADIVNINSQLAKSVDSAIGFQLAKFSHPIDVGIILLNHMRKPTLPKDINLKGKFKMLNKAIIWYVVYVKMKTLWDQLSFMELQFICAADSTTFEAYRQETQLVQFFYGSNLSMSMLGVCFNIDFLFPQLIWLYLNCYPRSKLGVRLPPRETTNVDHDLVSASPTSLPGIPGPPRQKGRSPHICNYWKQQTTGTRIVIFIQKVHIGALVIPSIVHKQVLSMQSFLKIQTLLISHHGFSPSLLRSSNRWCHPLAPNLQIHHPPQACWTLGPSLPQITKLSHGYLISATLVTWPLMLHPHLHISYILLMALIYKSPK